MIKAPKEATEQETFHVFTVNITADKYMLKVNNRYTR